MPGSATLPVVVTCPLMPWVIATADAGSAGSSTTARPTTSAGISRSARTRDVEGWVIELLSAGVLCQRQDPAGSAPGYRHCEPCNERPWAGSRWSGQVGLDQSHRPGGPRTHG